MSEFLQLAVEEENGALPDLRAVEGKTTKCCPFCGKARRRHYDVVGPLRKDQLDPVLKKIEPRISAKQFWKKIGLAWLVSPPNPPKEGEYYEIRIFATCTNRNCRGSGTVRVPEREGYRQFGLIERLKISLRASLHAGIDRIIPL